MNDVNPSSPAADPAVFAWRKAVARDLNDPVRWRAALATLGRVLLEQLPAGDGLLEDARVAELERTVDLKEADRIALALLTASPSYLLHPAVCCFVARTAEAARYALSAHPTGPGPAVTPSSIVAAAERDVNDIAERLKGLGTGRFGNRQPQEDELLDWLVEASTRLHVAWEYLTQGRPAFGTVALSPRDDDIAALLGGKQRCDRPSYRPSDLVNPVQVLAARLAKRYGEHPRTSRRRLDKFASEESATADRRRLRWFLTAWSHPPDPPRKRGRRRT